MAVTVPWPAIGSFVAGVISLFFLRYLWPYRGEKGANYFIGVIGCVTLWTVSYGLALLAFEPTLRFAFEIPIWLAINGSAVFFLAFAFEYTGRTGAVKSTLMRGLVGFQLLMTALVATNPIHGLVWSEYDIEPVAGVAGVAVTNEPLLFAMLLITGMITTAGIVLLADAFASYGPLYRYQTLAVAVSPLPVFAGILLWAFQVGPVPQLNLAPLLFPVHLGLDMYAFFRRNMFELTPAARRAGNQTAIDDLGLGVVIVDDDTQIINLNETAAEIFDREKRALLGTPLENICPEVDLAATDQRIQRRSERRKREYAVSVSEITDSSGTPIGHTVTLQDITVERQREQRLAVLNRVLRHNLRNDLNVATGYLDIAAEDADEEIGEMLSVASRNIEGVLELGEKARTVERTLESDELGTQPIEMAAVIDELTPKLTEEYGGTVENRVPADLMIETNPQLLESLFANLIENGLEHGGEDGPAVTVDGVEDGETAQFEVHDDGPGIPSHELEVLKEGEETDLEHGSGIGLWIVTWASAALGGEVDFETGPDGTTVTVQLPGVVGSTAADGTSTAESRSA
ncbi:histidine kinase N-terminal 7TM domain-containing protein [Halohasta salina]|uniref:histidine kinase N-terminal 7TM domain-containing protein n=1 Tax=Halohasta salina TaxID=2961621 RepID=UPI0020A56F4C|nr:histidine kinase N-terminal 7TM domain-containing protein [Halohasta salina]